MINIVFNDTIFGNLKHAKYIASKKGLSVDLDDNLLLINLQLSQGDISDNGIGHVRLDFLKHSWSGYLFGEDDLGLGDDQFKLSMKSVERIKEAISNGDEFRIWYSEENDEYCALCWLLSLFDELNAKNKILVIKFPSETELSDGKYMRCCGTGCFNPDELLEYVMKQKSMSESFKTFHIEQWRRAQKENMSLRVVLNGNIISASEDFYDSAIMVESNKLGEIINETQLVGMCVAKLCLSDDFVGKRIEYMINRGIFQVVNQPEKCTPFYRKTIKRIYK
jgi:hypothetical protein